MIERDANLDIIRASAAFFVVLIHVSCKLFYGFSQNWDICVAYESMSRMSVALFSMLSGYLLFDVSKTKKEAASPCIFLRQRLTRLLIPFVMVMFIYYLLGDVSWQDFFRQLARNEVGYHLWYVYVVFGIYFIMPFLRQLFFTDNSTRITNYFIFIWFLASIFYPLLLAFSGKPNDPFGIFNFFCFVGYTVFGGLLRRHVTRYPAVVFLCLYLVSTVLIFLSTKWYSGYLGKPTELFFEHFTPFVFFQAASFFLFIKNLRVKFSLLISTISKLSYFIYLTHIIVLDIVLKYISIDKASILSIPIVALMVVFFSAIISAPLYKIEKILNPLLKLEEGYRWKLLGRAVKRHFQ